MKTRQIVAIIFGFILLYKTSQTKYHTDFVDAFVWFGMTLFGIIFFIVVFIKDSRQYGQEKKFRSFISTFIVVASALLSVLLGFIINYDQHKPTWVKAYYDGDYNGVGIDLKTDGSYVLDDSAIGTSDYTYGDYRISGDTIILDNALVKRLVFRKIGADLYLMEIDSSGRAGIEFRMTQDNR